MQSKTEKALALAKEGKHWREIRELVPCSKTLAFNMWKKVHGAEVEAMPKEVKVEVEAKEVTPTFPLEPKKPEPEELEEAPEAEAKLEKALIEGYLQPEDIQYIFESLNQLFPEKHQRPEKAMILLGKVWAKPTNRLLEELMERNIDIYLALVCTLIIFAPSLKGVFTEQMEKRKKTAELQKEAKP